MALWRISQAFRNDSQLQQFVLSSATPTGRILGTGSYGSVEEVSYKHLVCAGKRLHETLIDVENEGVAEVVRKYLQECQLMSSLRHPNITQFLGLCFLPGTQLPLLVMERLETSLDDLLEHMPNLPLSLKRSVLEDVACGLLYLHDRQPPVIHRDLTSRNVLLTSSLVAKITDMGNSRIVTMRPGQMTRTLTKIPGTLVYMPPEAQDELHSYGTAIDVFSFGHLALFTITQIFPGNLRPSTYLNPNNSQEIKGRSEIERRGVYIEILESQVNSNLPGLVELVKQCLQNDPCERPSTEQLLTRLQGMRGQVEGDYGGAYPIKLDMVRVRLAKELKEKDRRIEELTQQKAVKEAELEVVQRRVGRFTRDLEANERQIEDFRAQIQEKNLQNYQLQNDIAELEETKRHLEEEVALKDEVIARASEREAADEAGIGQLLKTTEAQESVKLSLTWTRSPDLPFGMSACVQSVVIADKLYVGGGEETLLLEDASTIMEYDSISQRWSTLPPYEVSMFTMVVMKGQLVLVGGEEDDTQDSKMLGVWEGDSKVWSHPYPDMPTARCQCSAVVYNGWLVIAGGTSGPYSPEPLPVEVMNIDTMKWYRGPSTPMSWFGMKTALVGRTAYFMGGYVEPQTPTYCMFSLDLQRLIASITTKGSNGRNRDMMWEEIPDLQMIWSTPLSFNGSLLAVGGWSPEHETQAAIHLYDPENENWVQIWDLPYPRYGCTCAMITASELFVAAGCDEHKLLPRQVYVGKISMNKH